jgi:16S rRNA (adenine1518-N6/adenine1519-N6)-dimethyltransferase
VGDPPPIDDGIARESFATYKELMRSYGFRPSRRLGQNFLLDASLHRVLVDAVNPGAGDLVLEIGPGLGFLTRELAGQTRVLAVEVDDRLVSVLRRELPGFPGGGESVRLLHADALQRSRLHPDLLEAIAEELGRLGPGGRFCVVANLPYAIAGPLIAELTLLPTPPVEMALLVQLEMAQRLSAVHDTREYGALTVQLQLGYDIRFVRKVGSQVFRPRPQVDSGIVHLRVRSGGVLDRGADERRELGGFLRQLFCSRRKKLRNARVLRDHGPLPGAEELLQLRPDAVAPAALLGLWDATRPGI